MNNFTRYIVACLISYYLGLCFILAGLMVAFVTTYRI